MQTAAEEQIQKILEESKSKLGYQLRFPQYNILPDEVKLAISVLKSHGMQIVFILESKE